MADTTLSVAVDTKDAVASLGSLKNAFAGLIAAASIKQLMDFSDSITNMTNRIRSLAPDLDSANKNFAAIVAISLSARAPLKDVSDLFTKLQITTRDLGISTRDVADITETLTKAMAISGTSTIEAQSAMYQFNQALALGVFQGNDLHAMIQTMPKVMQGFADSIGVPLGALKDLGTSGSITADMFIKYMKSIKDKTNDEFSALGPTFAGAFNDLKTASSAAFADFESNSNIGKGMAQAIDLIAFSIFKFSKNIDDAVGPIKTFLQIVGALAAFTLVGKVFTVVLGIVSELGTAWALLTEAGGILVTSWEIMVGAFTSGAGSITYLWQVITKGMPFLLMLSEAVASVAAAIYSWTGIGDAVEWVKKLGDKSEETGERTKKLREEFEAQKKELEKTKDAVDDTVKANVAAEFQAKKVAYAISLVSLAARQQTADLKINLDRVKEKLDFDTKQIVTLDALGNVTNNFTNKSKDQIEVDAALRDLSYEKADAIKKLTDEQAKLQAELKNPAVLADAEQAKILKGKIGVIGDQITKEKQLYDQQEKALPKYIINLQSAKMLEEARKVDTENMIKAIDEQIARQHKLGDVLQEANKKRFGATNDKTPAEMLVGLTSLEKKIIDIQDANQVAAREAGRAFAESFGDQEMTIEKSKELADGLDAIAEAYRLVSGTESEVARNSYEVQRQWSTGWSDAWAKYKEDAGNAAEQVSNTFGDFTKGMEDAFVSFVQTGKLSFSSLANSIVADLARIAFKKAVVGLGSLFGFAAGGDVMGNTPIIVGERGPELFVPSTAGKIIPNNQLGTGQGSGIGGQTVVNYNIQAVDASSFRSLVARDPSFIYAVTEQGRRSQPTRRAF